MNFNYEVGLFYRCFNPSHYLQIAHFKIPRHVQFMADFPKTVSGKVQKFQLRKMVLEEEDQTSKHRPKVYLRGAILK
jgi:acyl-CoA synthetase (AMP-forming)/AMP-acid ligase II